MSVHYDRQRGKYMVRWREDGRNRVRRFDTIEAAEAFDVEVKRSHGWTAASARGEQASPPRQQRGDGIYPYRTRRGSRWRFKFRQSDGTVSSRRGFTSHRAAATARRRLVESIERGEVKVSRETFETFWKRLGEEKRPYMTAGAHLDLMTHGRKRLVPFFGSDRLASIDADRVRAWLAMMVDLVEAGELAPKTVNNARTWLSMAFGEAVRRGLMPRNPCSEVPLLPVEASEIDFLRLAEIGPYLECCSDEYRPLAEFLIGSGARVSEAVAVRWSDLDLEHGVARIHRQRSRTGAATAPTKGKRFRGVQIGPRAVRDAVRPAARAA